MAPKAVVIRRARRRDVNAVAAALGAAFVGDPWIAWIVDADRHQQRISALQAKILGAVGMDHGEVWMATRGRAVIGAALWLLADRPVPAAAWRDVAATEAGLMGRRHAHAAAAAAATRHLRPQTPHHLLASLGVIPGERGRGTGAALLAPVLERADRDGVECYLETSTERNLRFYARLGFEQQGHVVVPDGGPPVWAMVRRPQRPRPPLDEPAAPGA